MQLKKVGRNTGFEGKSENMGFKGSGSLGSAADVGIIIRRNFESEINNDYADIECFVRKNRYGRTGVFNLVFDKKTGFIL